MPDGASGGWLAGWQRAGWLAGRCTAAGRTVGGRGAMTEIGKVPPVLASGQWEARLLTSHPLPPAGLFVPPSQERERHGFIGSPQRTLERDPQGSLERRKILPNLPSVQVVRNKVLASTTSALTAIRFSHCPSRILYSIPNYAPVVNLKLPVKHFPSACYRNFYDVILPTSSPKALPELQGQNSLID